MTNYDLQESSISQRKKTIYFLYKPDNLVVNYQPWWFFLIIRLTFTP